jgi:hypothetical protein
MKSRYSRIVWSGALSLLLAVVTSLAQAASTPLPPTSHAFGKSYSELTAGWLEWVLAIPATANPLLDNDGAFAGVGQSGKVWFLVGNTTGGVTTRTVTVPAGTALFFPIVNYFWVNTPEFGDPPWSPKQEADVREFMAATVDTAHNMVLEIDGRPVPNVSGLRVSGAVGKCTIPTDNIFGVTFAPEPHDCVADGYWALLPPLSNGHHTIRFAGEFASSGFSLDVTYHITVRGR